MQVDPQNTGDAPQILVERLPDRAIGEGELSHADELGGDGEQGSSPTRRSSRRVRSAGAWLPVLWVVVIVVLAVTADLLPLPDPNLSGTDRSQTPEIGHWLGTDELARDIFARIAKGAQVSLTVGVVSVAIGMVIGGVIGLVAGYWRGAVERVLMIIVDVLLAFPPLVLIILLVASLRGASEPSYGEALRNITAAIAVLTVAPFARISRSATLTYAQRDFVVAARSVGASNTRIMFRELLPNIVPTVRAYALVVMAVVVIAEGSLAFLGLSIPRPNASWGSMIDGARGELVNHGTWWPIAVPSAFMFLTVLSFNLIGDRLRSRDGDVRTSVM